MPYLQFDVDAKKKMAWVAQLAGVSRADAAWGLMEVWEYAWMAGSDELSELVLTGLIGPSEALRKAYAAYGFIEQLEGGNWRVKGTDRYSKAEEARSRGGKAAAGNLRRGAVSGASSPAAPRLAPGCLPAAAGVQPEVSPGCLPGKPITDNQEPITKKQQQQADAADGLLAFWNEHAHPKLARVRAMTSNRKTALRARLKEHQPEELEEAIRRLGASSFCLGGGSQGWMADLDWLLRPGTVAKVLEGKYDDRGAAVVPLRVPCSHDGCGADSTCNPYGNPLCEAHAREHEAFFRGTAG